MPTAFDDESARRIAKVVRAAEAEKARSKGVASGFVTPNTAAMQFVRLTSAVQTASRYPGKWVTFEDTNTGTTGDDQDAIWVVCSRGTTLTTGVNYLARWAGYANSRPVYRVSEPAGGGGSPGGAVGDVQLNDGAGGFTASADVNYTDPLLTIKPETAATNSATNILTIGHNSSGTPAAGFGLIQQYQLESSTTASTDAARETITWATATHASRAGQWSLGVNDSGGLREAITVTANNTGSTANVSLAPTSGGIVTIGTSSYLALPQATPTAAGQLAYSTSTGLLSYYNGVTSAAYSLANFGQQLSEPSTYQVGTTDIESWHITGQVNANHAGFSTKTLADDGLYAIPFLSGHGGTLDRIAFYCQGTTGTNKVMLGIYEAVSSTNRYPGAKLVAATELTTAAAGAGWSGVIAATTNMIYTLSQALTPGKLYWMVMNVDVGGSLVVGSVGQTWNIFGSSSTLSAPTNRCWLEGTRTYDSTLPATFTSSIATSTNVQMPSIFRRYSA